MGQILAVVSSKGGVGKTTTAVNLAAAFASLDFSTLLIEADPQCGLVASFGYDRFDLPKGLADVARGECPLEDAAFETPVPGLHVVSSNVWSQEEESLYLGAVERDPLALRRAFASLRERYDYLLIDAPPMLGPITLAILAAADRFLVPVQTEPQSVRILPRLIEAAGRIRERFNPALHFDGIALTMVDGRTRMSQRLEETLRAEWPDHVFRATIPRSIRLAEIPASGRPLVLAAPASRGGQAYASLAEEILAQHARDRMMARAMAGEPEGDENGSHDADDRLSAVIAALVGDGKAASRRVAAERTAAIPTERAATPPPETPASTIAPVTSATEPFDLASLGLPAEEEWDDRFVDLESYLEMESGGTAKTAVADVEWDEDDWNDLERDGE